MTPYYQEDGITLYCGDCRGLLPMFSHLKDVPDLVLTDFPYGNGTEYGRYDDSQENLINLITEVVPLIRHYPVALLTCGVGNIHLFPQPKWILNWTVSAGVGAGPWGFCSWQPILAYGSDPYLKNGLGRRPDTLITNSVSDNNGHPCPKPLSVWKWILTRGSVFTKDIILDPFCGSGTTLVAAKQLGRKAIGIEIEEKYCEIAVKRLAQMELFR